MSWSASMLLSDTVADVFNNVIALNAGSDTFNIALFDDSITPSPDTSNAAFGVAPWDSGEVFGTGWATGGVALASFVCSVVSSTGVKFDATDVSESSTTLDSAVGALIYDTTISSRALIAVYFGSAYSTSNGTFAITWDASGIAVLDLTP
jgi:hypothetical protein